MESGKEIVAIEQVENLIILVRGHKVMLDRDLASLYGVATSNLNKAVSRNRSRFPEDFMFRLTKDEFNDLIFHFGTSSWGGTRTPPRVFTEQGVAMLSSVLRSKRAVLVNVEIMRTFIKIRGLLATNNELARRIDTLETKYDHQFKVVFDAIRELMTSRKEEHRKIGSGGVHSTKISERTGNPPNRIYSTSSDQNHIIPAPTRPGTG